MIIPTASFVPGQVLVKKGYMTYYMSGRQSRHVSVDYTKYVTMSIVEIAGKVTGLPNQDDHYIVNVLTPELNSIRLDILSIPEAERDYEISPVLTLKRQRMQGS